MPTRRSLATVVAVAVVLLSGCGSGAADDAAAVTSKPTVTATAEATPTPTPTPTPDPEPYVSTRGDRNAYVIAFSRQSVEDSGLHGLQAFTDAEILQLVPPEMQKAALDLALQECEIVRAGGPSASTYLATGETVEFVAPLERVALAVMHLCPDARGNLEQAVASLV